MNFPEWVAFISTLAAMVSACAAWAAVLAAKGATRQQAYLAITQILSLDEQMRANRDLLCRLVPDHWANWTLDEKNASRRFCAALNVAAVFDSRGMMPHGLLLEQYYVVFAHAWHHAGPWIVHERLHMPGLYEDFVKLAKRAQEKCIKDGVNIANLTSESEKGS